MTLDRSRLDGHVDANAQTLIGVAHKIHAHPELKFAEHKASAWLLEEAVLIPLSITFVLYAWLAKDAPGRPPARAPRCSAPGRSGSSSPRCSGTWG